MTSTDGSMSMSAYANAVSYLTSTGTSFVYNGGTVTMTNATVSGVSISGSTISFSGTFSTEESKLPQDSTVKHSCGERMKILSMHCKTPWGSQSLYYCGYCDKLAVSQRVHGKSRPRRMRDIDGEPEKKLRENHTDGIEYVRNIYIQTKW